MTTDFVVTMTRDGRHWTQARTGKPSQQLASRRVLEKFEVERRYWETRGIDWGIVTELNIPAVMVRNIDLFRVYRRIDDRGLLSSDIACIAAFMSAKLRNLPQPLSIVASQCDEILGYPPGGSLVVAYHFIATREWQINFNHPFNPNKIFILQERKACDAAVH